MNDVTAINQQVSALPPEYQRGVLDFVEYPRDRRAPDSTRLVRTRLVACSARGMR